MGKPEETDVYHVTVAGVNPHSLAAEWGDNAESPFYDPYGGPSVAQHIINDSNELVGGIVDLWAGEHLTPAQESFLYNNEHVIDIRHVWPEDCED